MKVDPVQPPPIFVPAVANPVYYCLLPAATKLGQCNVFTGICDSVKGGSASVYAGIPSPSRPPWEQTPPEADTPLEQTSPGKQTPTYGQRAAGTHPTGMHSCLCMQMIGERR